MKDETAEWASFAKGNIRAAQKTIDDAELTREVIFWCQQAIEKYLKAYLVEHDKKIRKTHDLLSIYAEVKSIQDWGLDEYLLNQISNIYTVIRYPKYLGVGLPQIEEAKRYLEFALDVEKIFCKLLGEGQ